MSKKLTLNLERLDNRVLLSNNPWYVDATSASNVWNLSSYGSNRPVVAIVDSGADLNHELLKNNLWHNPIDNSVGYDFVQNDNDPTGVFYHGTHVAGIIENMSNKSVDLMILRFMDDNGVGYAGAAASAIDYATLMKLKGVNVVAINCSFGGILSYSIPLANSIQRASDNGIDVVLAAGNNGSDIDSVPRYPGSLNYTNTITVGAINPDYSLAGYSNYGANSVSVAAPGTDIVSSLPNNNYGSVSGTSMAAAVVSGEVGLLSSFGKYSATQIKNAILKGCDYVAGLVDKVKYGLIDVAKSLNILTSEPIVPSPAPVTVVKPISQNNIVPPVINKIIYGFDIVSNRVIKGWAGFTQNTGKPIVEIYINNIKRYSVTSNLYRSVSNSNNGFNVSINKSFLYLKKNLVEIRIKDASGSLSVIAYRNYVFK